MPLSVSVSLSRKAGPDPMAITYSINITAELDVSLLTQPKELHERIAGLYAQATRALDEQAAAKPPPVPASPMPAQPNAETRRTYRDRLSRKEAAEYLGVKPETLAAWAATGRHSLPFTRVGGRIIYSRAELDRWMAERTGTSVGQIQARDAAKLSNHLPRRRASRT